MSLILSGTDGLSDIDGSAATPAIRGTDANTGIFFPAADTIAFSEGGVEAMRITSAGNVGIGSLATYEAKLKIATTNGAADFSSSGINVCGAAEITSGQVLPISFTPIGNDSNRARAAIGCIVGTNWGFGNLGFYTRGVADGSLLTTADEKMRINSSGNVGIGTDTANATGTVRQLTVSNAGTPEFVLRDTSQAVDSRNWRIFNASNTLYLGTLNDAGTAGTDVAKFTSAGLFQFNSGYGSVATAYGCRAWVNFNGTGVVAIRGSGNVSSITDNGVGVYTVNFTTAMPDANYCTNVTGTHDGGAYVAWGVIDNDTPPTTSAVRVNFLNPSSSSVDVSFAQVSIIR